jgi:hypothetical protein
VWSDHFCRLGQAAVPVRRMAGFCPCGRKRSGSDPSNNSGVNPMKNPHESLLSGLKDQSANSGARLLPLILGVGFAVLSALIPTVVTSTFKEVFDEFGVELPMTTQLLFDYYHFLWSLPILVIVVYFFWPKKKKLPLWLGIFSLVFTILFMVAAHIHLVAI